MQYEVSFAADFKNLTSYFPESEADSRFCNGFHSSWIAEKNCGKQPINFLNPATGGQTWRFMEWGCLPFNSTDPLISSRRWTFMLHTPAERIFGDVKSYWHRIRDQRCLIPANGFYIQGTVQNMQHEVPYFLHVPDQPVFFLPVLYSTDEALDMTTGQKTQRWVFTMISKPADCLAKHLDCDQEKSTTMPLLLPFSLSRHWLDHDLNEADYRSILDFEMSSEALQAWPIYSTQQEEQRPDNKEKNERFDWEKHAAVNVGTAIF
ncbi:MAG: SOS response-associated peptidase family protein [Williamsia sp.]|nr:SOS response-associated peptidase family protein [Williamsia sp.]